MQTKTFLISLLSLTAVAEASAIKRPFDNILARRALDMEAGTKLPRNPRGGFGGFGGNQGGQNNGQNNGQNGNNGNNAASSAAAATATSGTSTSGSGTNNAAGSAITLDAQNIQTGSQTDGDPAASSGESASQTDPANFINFCSGKLLTNGLQQKQGSCNGIVMGNIPSTNNMVSSVFVNPQNLQNINANEDFNITVQMANFAPGTFTNADTTYYSAPQDLDGSGNIIGHTHVTVQDLGNDLNPTTPLDATQFAFFKGINDAGNGQGLLSAAVAGGLPTGNYRVCSMSSSANHQPVLMPVAQRGAQDDCVRFTVGGGSGSAAGNNGGNNNNSGSNSNSNTSSASASATPTANSSTQSNSSSGALGGFEAPAVTDSGDSSRPFEVQGDTFVNKSAAVQRACDIQQNQCSDAANSGASFTVSDCQQQQATCESSAN